MSDIVDQTGVSQPTVSHHLGILREAGLVATRREGKQVFYTLNQEEVAVCCGNLMQNFAPEKSISLVDSANDETTIIDED